MPKTCVADTASGEPVGRRAPQEPLPTGMSAKRCLRRAGSKDVPANCEYGSIRPGSRRQKLCATKAFAANSCPTRTFATVFFVDGGPRFGAISLPQKAEKVRFRRPFVGHLRSGGTLLANAVVTRVFVQDLRPPRLNFFYSLGDVSGWAVVFFVEHFAKGHTAPSSLAFQPICLRGLKRVCATRRA